MECYYIFMWIAIIQLLIPDADNNNIVVSATSISTINEQQTNVIRPITTIMQRQLEQHISNPIFSINNNQMIERSDNTRIRLRRRTNNNDNININRRIDAVISTESNNNETTTNSTSASTAPLELQLWFSIWFPAFNNKVLDVEYENELNDIFKNSNNAVRLGVLKSFGRLLCQETDIIIINNETISTSNNNNYIESNVVDYCLLAKQQANNVNDNQRQRHLQQLQLNDLTGDTKILNNPKVNIRRRSQTSVNETTIISDELSGNVTIPKNITLSWTVWTVTYEVINVGSIYTQETLLNQPNIKYTDLGIESIQTMEEVIQIAIDVNLRNGILDTILEQDVPKLIINNKINLNGPTAYASPIRYEFNTFSANYQKSLNTLPPFIPRKWYPMRACGVALLVMDILIYYIFYLLSERRRKRNIKIMEENDQDQKLLNDDELSDDDDNDESNSNNKRSNKEDRFSLHNIQGVENMLNQSSQRFNYHDAAASVNGGNDTLIKTSSSSDSEISSNTNNSKKKKKRVLPNNTTTTTTSPLSVTSPTRVRDSPFVYTDPNVTIPSSVGKVALSILKEVGNEPTTTITERTTGKKQPYLSSSSSSSSSSNNSFDDNDDGSDVNDEGVIDLLN